MSNPIENAINTIGITLKCGTSKDAMTKLVDIKDYPDLGGEPNTIDTTTLSDEAQVFIMGLQTTSALSFTANYTDESYDKVKGLAKQQLFYSLEFGENGSKGGTFDWQGQHDAYVVGAGTDAGVDMKITVVPSTKIDKRKTTPAT